MIGFLVIGGVGLAIVVLSLVLGDLFEGLFDGADIDVGGGLLSAPVIGAFLAALGFGGALVMAGTGGGVGIGLAGGLAAGGAFGWATLRITRAAMNMATDAPMRLTDTVGKSAHVVTPIPEGGLGEISFVHLGQRMKLSARAPRAVPLGAGVVITAVTSPSSVLVEPETEFWGDAELGPGGPQ